MHTGHLYKAGMHTRRRIGARHRIFAPKRPWVGQIPGAILSLLAAAFLAAVVAVADAVPANAFAIFSSIPSSLPNPVGHTWFLDPDRATCGLSTSCFGWGSSDDDLSIEEAFSGVDAADNPKPCVDTYGSGKRESAVSSCSSKLLAIDDPDSGDGPYGSLTGGWEAVRTEQTDSFGFEVDDGALAARIATGLTLTSPGGVMRNGQVFYSGLGMSNHGAYVGGVTAAMPRNNRAFPPGAR